MSAARQVGGGEQPAPCSATPIRAGMPGWSGITESDRTRAVRIRVCLGRVRDVRRSFRVPADADLAAAMKRAALAAIPT